MESCGTQPTLRSQGGTGAGPPSHRSPTTSTCPVTPPSTPAITRSSVLFPAPDGPLIPTTRASSPRATRNPRTATSTFSHGSPIEVEPASLASDQGFERRQRSERQHQARDEEGPDARVAVGGLEQ